VPLAPLDLLSVKFSAMTSSKKVTLGYSNNDREPEMAAETGNTYISETMRDTTFEIPTANLRFTTIERLKKLSVSNFNRSRQPEIAI